MLRPSGTGLACPGGAPPSGSPLLGAGGGFFAGEQAPGAKLSANVWKAKQKITPRALMELKMPGDVQVAPDGRRVAYSVSETDWDGNRIAQHLYVAIASDDDTAPRQLTRGLAEETDPAGHRMGSGWPSSPRGTRRTRRGRRRRRGNPKVQVWLLPMDGLGGEAERLTDAPEGVEAMTGCRIPWGSSIWPGSREQPPWKTPARTGRTAKTMPSWSGRKNSGSSSGGSP